MEPTWALPWLTRVRLKKSSVSKTSSNNTTHTLQEEVSEARAFGDLIGQSGALRQLVSQIDLVAPTDASVLIQGETGTGKELVAREIHRRSARRTSRWSG